MQIRSSSSSYPWSLSLHRYISLNILRPSPAELGFTTPETRLLLRPPVLVQTKFLVSGLTKSGGWRRDQHARKCKNRAMQDCKHIIIYRLASRGERTQGCIRSRLKTRPCEVYDMSSPSRWSPEIDASLDIGC